MTNGSLAEIVEVAEAGGITPANKYLKAGYRLLMVEMKTSARPMPTDTRQSYVQRRPVFVLGRTADVAHFEYEPAAKQEAVPA